MEPRKALIQHGLTVEKFDFYEKLMRWSVPRPFINVMLNVRFPLSTLLLTSHVTAIPKFLYNRFLYYIVKGGRA